MYGPELFLFSLVVEFGGYGHRAIPALDIKEFPNERGNSDLTERTELEILI